MYKTYIVDGKIVSLNSDIVTAAASYVSGILLSSIVFKLSLISVL